MNKFFIVKLCRWGGGEGKRATITYGDELKIEQTSHNLKFSCPKICFSKYANFTPEKKNGLSHVSSLKHDSKVILVTVGLKVKNNCS